MDIVKNRIGNLLLLLDDTFCTEVCLSNNVCTYKDNAMRIFRFKSGYWECFEKNKYSSVIYLRKATNSDILLAASKVTDELSREYFKKYLKENL